MKEIKNIALKRLLFNKTESVFVVAVISVIIAALLFSFSLSINYFSFFLAEAENLTGESLSKVFENSISNLSEIGKYIAEFTLFFVGYEIPEKIEDIVPLPSAHNSDFLFSAESLVENLPFTIIIMVVVVLIVACISLSIVFSACKRERRKFFSVLLLSGASDKQIKKCAFYEGIYYSLAALPVGLVLGITEVYILKFFVAHFFDNLGLQYNGLSFPIEYKFSMLSLLIVIPFVFLVVCSFSKKACKKLSIKTTASQIRQTMGADIGLSTFTAKPAAYKRKGIEYYVAIRNFQNNFSKYFKIIFMTVTYTAIIGLTFVIFNVIRNYNGQDIISNGTGLLSFSFYFQAYFCSVAVILCIVSLVSTFIAVFTNINSNIGEYAVMRSLGSSVKSVLKAVKIEGVICSVSGVVFSIACVLYSVTFMMEIYSNDLAVHFGGFGTVAGIVCIALAMFTLCVLSTVLMVNKKMKKLDTVKVLKDYLY